MIEAVPREEDKLRVCGIDQSLAHTGIVVLDCWLEKAQLVVEVKHAAEIPTLPGRLAIERALDIGDGIDDVLGAYEPHRVAMEGYSYGNMEMAHSLAEVGAMVKIVAYKHLLEWPLIVAPTRLKRYATARGQCEKAEMVAAARQAGFETRNHNLADAFWLAHCAAGAAWFPDIDLGATSPSRAAVMGELHTREVSDAELEGEGEAEEPGEAPMKSDKRNAGRRERRLEMGDKEREAMLARERARDLARRTPARIAAEKARKKAAREARARAEGRVLKEYAPRKARA